MQSFTTEVRNSPPRRPARRAATTVISLITLTSLLMACAPAATTPAAPPSAPAAAPAAPAPAVSAPAKPAEPAAKPASPATGQIVIVFEADPITIVPKDAFSNNGYFVLDNVYDHLTGRDYSSGTGKLVPQLAESWTRIEPKTWRFKLRQDVKFTNGEVFNADAVVTAIEDIADPQKPGLAAGEYGTLQSAKKVDDFTAEITTRDPDPILPERMVHFPIAAPKWVKAANLTAASTEAIGSGPYLLAEYLPGDHMLFKANPNYWGPNKPKIAEIKLIGRKEQAVRAAMLQAGEADLAFHIALDDSKQAARSIIEQTQESVMIIINSEHPVMKDLRVRQAIVAAIDVQGMINALYPGGLGVPLTGQGVRQGTVGWNPNLKPSAYKPDDAKRLVQEAGAVGTPLEYIDRPGSFPRAGEVSELIANWLNQVGFKATVRHLEPTVFNEKKRAVKPGQETADLLQTSVSSPILDSSRIFDFYYVCGSLYRIGCDPEFDRKYTDAKDLTGEAREKAFQGLWEYASDKLWYMPMFGLNWVHGATARLQWAPRIDGQVRFTEMSLNP